MSDESFVSSKMVGIEDKTSAPTSISPAKAKPVSTEGEQVRPRRREVSYQKPFIPTPDTVSPADIKRAPYHFKHPDGFTALPPDDECLPIPYSLCMQGQFVQYDYKPYSYFCEFKAKPPAPMEHDFLVWVRRKNITPEQVKLMQSEIGREALAKFKSIIVKRAEREA